MVVVVVVAVAAVRVVGVAEDDVAVERLAVGVDHLDVVDQPVERLALADLGRQLGHQVVLLVGLAHLVRLLVELHRHPLVLEGEVALVGIEALGGGDGAQREVDAHGLLGRPLHALDEAVGVLAGDRQPLLDVDALRLQLAHGALDAPLQVALHERLRRVDLGEAGERLGDPADELLAGLVELRLRQPLGDRGPPRLDGLVLAEVLGDEVVGELGQHELLDGRHA